MIPAIFLSLAAALGATEAPEPNAMKTTLAPRQEAAAILRGALERIAIHPDDDEALLRCSVLGRAARQAAALAAQPFHQRHPILTGIIAGVGIAGGIHLVKRLRESNARARELERLAVRRGREPLAQTADRRRRADAVDVDELHEHRPLTVEPAQRIAVRLGSVPHARPREAAHEVLHVRPHLPLCPLEAPR